MTDILLFAFCLLVTGALLFLLVYYVITLSDVECDYLNAQECCSALNSWVLPRLVLHWLVTALLLLTGHWYLFFANVPMTSWLTYEFIKVPRGNFGVFDPTEIYNRGQLKKHMRDCVIGLVFYLLGFFFYLYSMILAMLAGDPIPAESAVDELMMM